MRKFRRLFTLFLVLALISACSTDPGTTHQKTSTNSSPPDLPPDLPPDSTLEEQLKWKEQFKDWAEKNGRIEHAAGEKTKGSVITIAGEKVKLPEDAFIKAFVTEDEGLGRRGETEHLPFYAIQRGSSAIMIAQKTGVVVNLVLDEADKKPFDFLKKKHPRISGRRIQIQISIILHRSISCLKI